MRILHITSVKNPKGNGVAVAISKYYEYEKKFVDVAVLNTNDTIDTSGNSYSIVDYREIGSLPNGFSKPDLVIFNEVYKPKYIKLYKECIRKKIPYIIIPHGCMTRASQRKSKVKKMVANRLLFNRFIDKSVAVQYLNKQEKEDSIIKNHKSFISGNGVDLKKKKNKAHNKEFIYIGRYDVKVKGLDLLIRTVVRYRKWFDDNSVIIRLFGRDTNNECREIKKMVEGYGVADHIIVSNAVYGQDKEKVLLSSYVFLQLSRHEGQPMGILEALSYGLPCIVTYGTSFGEYVNNNSCGIGIDFNETDLFCAMKKMFANESLRNKYAKQSKIVEEDYEWEKSIKQCLKKYEVLL